MPPTAAARSLGLLNEYLGDCIGQLALRPRGTHLGELGWNHLAESLPRRWLTRYDYDFCWQLRERLTAISTGSTAGWD
jgi:hypothetical protein